MGHPIPLALSRHCPLEWVWPGLAQALPGARVVLPSSSLESQASVVSAGHSAYREAVSRGGVQIPSTDPFGPDLLGLLGG